MRLLPGVVAGTASPRCPSARRCLCSRAVREGGGCHAPTGRVGLHLYYLYNLYAYLKRRLTYSGVPPIMYASEFHWEL